MQTSSFESKAWVWNGWFTKWALVLHGTFGYLSACRRFIFVLAQASDKMHWGPHSTGNNVEETEKKTSSPHYSIRLGAVSLIFRSLFLGGVLIGELMWRYPKLQKTKKNHRPKGRLIILYYIVTFLFAIKLLHRPQQAWDSLSLSLTSHFALSYILKFLLQLVSAVCLLSAHFKLIEGQM